MVENVVAFDLDDTLAPERVYAESGLRAVGDFLERETGERGVAQALVDRMMEGGRHTILNDVLPLFNIDCGRIPDLIRRYREHTPELELEQKVTDVLNQLKSMGHPLALITDGPAVTQRAKIRALKLETWFDLIVVTDELGRDSWKPSLAPYHRVMSHFAKHDAFIYVGDNPEKDFVTAKSLGWLTVQVTRPDAYYLRTSPDDEHAAHYEIQCLSQLVALLP